MIKIKTKKKNILIKPQRERDLSQYIEIDLEDYVKDSVLKSIFIDRAAAAAIKILINKSLLEDPVCEVGGFLLGQVDSDEEIYIDRFIEAKAIDKSSPNRLHFGAGALGELSNAIEVYPDCLTMGWFHTHTVGDTPFLSALDIRIHDNFFIENYQIAIVIDVLTEGFQAGIFTRQKSGRINNASNVLPDQLINWKTLLAQ